MIPKQDSLFFEVNFEKISLEYHETVLKITFPYCKKCKPDDPFRRGRYTSPDDHHREQLFEAVLHI